jgi:hypothetical protein
MEVVRQWYDSFGGLARVIAALEKDFSLAPNSQQWVAADVLHETSQIEDEVSFSG